MSNSRAHILASIRQSLSTAKHLPSAPAVVLPPPASAATELLLEQFATELRALQGQCITVPSAEVAVMVARLLHDRESSTFLAWDETHLPVTGVLADLAQQGFTRVSTDLPHTEPERSRQLAVVEQVRVGLTGAEAALADTGSLAVRAGPGRPRLASLSVRTHIALITPAHLYASWGAWWANGPTMPDSSNLTLISGPSRTADIEMTLTVGVHGPQEVIAVVCV